VYCVGVALACGPYVLACVEIRADLHGSIRRAGVQRAAIVGRDDGDRGNPLGAAGAKNAQRNLTAVRYEQALHRGDSNPAVRIGSLASPE
jgi:hypothetical protein